MFPCSNPSLSVIPSQNPEERGKVSDSEGTESPGITETQSEITTRPIQLAPVAPRKTREEIIRSIILKWIEDNIQNKYPDDWEDLYRHLPVALIIQNEFIDCVKPFLNNQEEKEYRTSIGNFLSALNTKSLGDPLLIGALDELIAKSKLIYKDERLNQALICLKNLIKFDCNFKETVVCELEQMEKKGNERLVDLSPAKLFHLFSNIYVFIGNNESKVSGDLNKETVCPEIKQANSRERNNLRLRKARVTNDSLKKNIAQDAKVLAKINDEIKSPSIDSCIVIGKELACLRKFLNRILMVCNSISYIDESLFNKEVSMNIDLDAFRRLKFSWTQYEVVNSLINRNIFSECFGSVGTNLTPPGEPLDSVDFLDIQATKKRKQISIAKAAEINPSYKLPEQLSETEAVQPPEAATAPVYTERSASKGGKAHGQLKQKKGFAQTKMEKRLEALSGIPSVPGFKYVKDDIKYLAVLFESSVKLVKSSFRQQNNESLRLMAAFSLIRAASLLTEQMLTHGQLKMGNEELAHDHTLLLLDELSDSSKKFITEILCFGGVSNRYPHFCLDVLKTQPISLQMMLNPEMITYDLLEDIIRGTHAFISELVPGYCDPEFKLSASKVEEEVLSTPNNLQKETANLLNRIEEALRVVIASIPESSDVTSVSTQRRYLLDAQIHLEGLKRALTNNSLPLECLSALTDTLLTHVEILWEQISEAVHLGATKKDLFTHNLMIYERLKAKSDLTNDELVVLRNMNTMFGKQYPNRYLHYVGKSEDQVKYKEALKLRLEANRLVSNASVLKAGLSLVKTRRRGKKNTVASTGNVEKIEKRLGELTLQSLRIIDKSMTNLASSYLLA